MTDPTAAVIPGADVTLTSPSLGADKTMQSDARGDFRFDSLPPGVYTLTITAQGFSRLVQSDIILDHSWIFISDLQLRQYARKYDLHTGCHSSDQWLFFNQRNRMLWFS